MSTTAGRESDLTWDDGFREGRNDALADITRLRAENAELREALRPFANVEIPRDRNFVYSHLRAHHFRRARTAIGET